MFDQTGADEGVVSWWMKQDEGILTHWIDHPGPLCAIVMCWTTASRTWQLGCELCASIVVHGRESGSSELALVWPIGRLAWEDGRSRGWLAKRGERRVCRSLTRKSTLIQDFLIPPSKCLVLPWYREPRTLNSLRWTWTLKLRFRENLQY